MNLKPFFTKAIAFTLCFTFTVTNSIAYTDSFSLAGKTFHCTSISHLTPPASAPHQFREYLEEKNFLPQSNSHAEIRTKSTVIARHKPNNVAPRVKRTRGTDWTLLPVAAKTEAVHDFKIASALSDEFRNDRQQKSELRVGEDKTFLLDKPVERVIKLNKTFRIAFAALGIVTLRDLINHDEWEIRKPPLGPGRINYLKFELGKLGLRLKSDEPNSVWTLDLPQYAKDALIRARITTKIQLANKSDRELLELPGLGPVAVRAVRKQVKYRKNSGESSTDGLRSELRSAHEAPSKIFLERNKRIQVENGYEAELNDNGAVVFFRLSDGKKVGETHPKIQPVSVLDFENQVKLGYLAYSYQNVQGTVGNGELEQVVVFNPESIKANALADERAELRIEGASHQKNQNTTNPLMTVRAELRSKPAGFDTPLKTGGFELRRKVGFKGDEGNSFNGYGAFSVVGQSGKEYPQSTRQSRPQLIHSEYWTSHSSPFPEEFFSGVSSQPNSNMTTMNTQATIRREAGDLTKTSVESDNDPTISKEDRRSELRHGGNGTTTVELNETETRTRNRWDNEAWANLEIRKRLKEEIGEKLGVQWIKELVEDYENLLKLPVNKRKRDQIEKLREKAYRINSSHFKSAGLTAPQNIVRAPQYQGRIVLAIIKAFGLLALEEKRFQDIREDVRNNIHFSWTDSGLDSAKEIRRRLKVFSGVPWLEDLVDRYEALGGNGKDVADNLEKLAYQIKAGHLVVSSLDLLLNPKKTRQFNGDYREIIIFAFPSLRLNQNGFQLQLATRAGKFFRAVYRLNPDGTQSLVDSDEKSPRAYRWDFLNEPSPYLVRTYLGGDGTVFVLPGREIEPVARTSFSGSKKVDSRLKYAPADIFYDERGNPIRTNVYADQRRTMLLTERPIRLFAIEARPRAGMRKPYDVYLEIYPKARREQLVSHQVNLVLNKTATFIFGNGIHGSQWGKFGFRPDGSINPAFSRAPGNAYFHDGYPFWINLFNKRNPKRYLLRHVYNRIYVAGSDFNLVRTHPFKLSSETWKGMLEKHGELMLEGNYRINKEGHIEVAGIVYEAKNWKGVPVAVRINNRGTAFVHPIVTKKNGNAKWDQNFFENQVRELVKDDWEDVPQDRSVILPSGLPENEREFYADIYNSKRLKQSGVRKLYEKFIYLGDIAFEDMFEHLGKEVLDQNVGDAHVGSGRLNQVRVISLNAIRRGETVINEKTIGSEAMAYIGGEIDLTQKPYSGFIPLILRGEAAKNLVWNAHLYIPLEIIPSLYHIYELSKERWEELFANSVYQGLEIALRNYDVTYKTLFKTYAWQSAEGKIREQAVAQVKAEKIVRKSAVGDELKEARKILSLNQGQSNKKSSDDEWTLLDKIEAPSENFQDSHEADKVKIDGRSTYKKFQEALKPLPELSKKHKLYLWFRLFKRMKYRNIGERFKVSRQAVEDLFENNIWPKLMLKPWIFRQLALLMGLDVDLDIFLSMFRKKDGNDNGSRAELRAQPSPANEEKLTAPMNGIEIETRLVKPGIVPRNASSNEAKRFLTSVISSRSRKTTSDEEVKTLSQSSPGVNLKNNYFNNDDKLNNDFDLDVTQAIEPEANRRLESVIQEIREARSELSRSELNLLGDKLTNLFEDNQTTSASTTQTAVPIDVHSAVLFLPKAAGDLGSLFGEILQAISSRSELRREVIVYADSPLMVRAIREVIRGVPGEELVQFVQSNEEAVRRAELHNIMHVRLIGSDDEIETPLVQNLASDFVRHGIQVITKSVSEFISFLGEKAARLYAEWKSAILYAKMA